VLQGEDDGSMKQSKSAFLSATYFRNHLSPTFCHW